MKKLLASVLLILSAISLSIPALADAALPPEGYIVRGSLATGPIIPIIFCVVIIVIVVLIKVIQTRRRK